VEDDLLDEEHLAHEEVEEETRRVSSASASTAALRIT